MTGYKVIRIPVHDPSSGAWVVLVMKGIDFNELASSSGLRIEPPHWLLGFHYNLKMESTHYSSLVTSFSDKMPTQVDKYCCSRKTCFFHRATDFDYKHCRLGSYL